MRLLVVASDPMEFRGIASHAREMRALDLRVDWARSGSLGVHDAVLVANGVGRVRAAAAVDAAVSRQRPDAIVSVGFCGALDESLGSAEIVAGTGVIGSGCRWPAREVSASMAFRSGTVYSSDHVVRTAQQKRELRKSGALVVEMEAAGVAQRAETFDLPFYCVRVITDLAGETLANDFNRALRPDGHFATMHILGGALRQPTVRVPELLRLRSRCVRAARGLGDFLADCRF